MKEPFDVNLVTYSGSFSFMFCRVFESQNNDEETEKVQMILWDHKAEDLFHPALQIYHINKDTTPDESHHQAKHQVMLLIQENFKTQPLSRNQFGCHAHPSE